MDVLLEIASPLVKGIFSIVGIVLSAFIPVLLASRKLKNKKAVKAQLSITESRAEKLGNSAPVVRAITDLLDSTNIDRVLVLVAFNGVSTPRHVTATYQWQESGQKFAAYKKVPIDDHYRSILKNCDNEKTVLYRLGDAPGTALDDIYQLEGIEQSYIVGVGKTKDGDVVKHDFMSYATHNLEGLTHKDMTAARLVTDLARANL